MIVRIATATDGWCQSFCRDRAFSRFDIKSGRSLTKESLTPPRKQEGVLGNPADMISPHPSNLIQTADCSS